MKKKLTYREQLLELLRDGYAYKQKDSLFFITIFWFITLFGTLFLSTSELSLFAGLSLFTFQSIAFGILLGFIMLMMDENDGIRALKITLLATIFCGFVGYSDIGQALNSSGYVHAFLFFGLMFEYTHA